MTGEPDDGGGPCVDDPDGGCVSPGADCVDCSPEGTTPETLVLTISGLRGCSAVYTIGNSTWHVPQVSPCVWATDFELPLGPGTMCNLVNPAIGSIYIARTGFGTFSGSIVWSVGVDGGLSGYSVEITFEAEWDGQCNELTFAGPVGSVSASFPETEDLCEECHDEFRPGGDLDGSAATFTLAAVDYNEEPLDSESVGGSDDCPDDEACCEPEGSLPDEIAVTITGARSCGGACDEQCNIDGTYILTRNPSVSDCVWYGVFSVPVSDEPAPGCEAYTDRTLYIDVSIGYLFFVTGGTEETPDTVHCNIQIAETYGDMHSGTETSAVKYGRCDELSVTTVNNYTYGSGLEGVNAWVGVCPDGWPTCDLSGVEVTVVAV